MRIMVFKVIFLQSVVLSFLIKINSSTYMETLPEVTSNNMSHGKIAVVTGSNRGIGFGVVKELCEKLKNGTVYLTARSLKSGQNAVEKLKALGLDPSFHVLDINDQASVDAFRDHLKKTHGKIDYLVNNAAINLRGPDPTGKDAEQTINVNYFGTLRVCEALFPLLNDFARVVTVSGSTGSLYRIPGTKIRNQFARKDLTISDLNNLMNQYIRDFKNNSTDQESWPDSAYTVSKVGLGALSIIQQRIFNEEYPQRNINLNFVHPGWVKTDMNKGGDITPEESAKVFSWLLLEASNDLKGKYVWYDKQIIDWYGPTSPPRYPNEH